MAKKGRTSQNVTERSGKGKEPKEDQRGRIVEVGTPLWQRNERKRHVQFKAGKMYMIDNMVHPDPRKGYVFIEQDYEHVMHFCWMERDAVGLKEDDLTPEPYDTIFKRVTKCTTGRVYVLKIRSTNQSHFFWMQEPSAEKDSEICSKVNYLLNFPPPWLRFPRIAINLEISNSSSETSQYDSSDETNTSHLVEPSGTQMTFNIENSQASCIILENSGNGSEFRTSTSLLELCLMCQDASEIITSDSFRQIMENSDLENRVGTLLPAQEGGKRDSLDNSTDTSNDWADAEDLLKNHEPWTDDIGLSTTLGNRRLIEVQAESKLEKSTEESSQENTSFYNQGEQVILPLAEKTLICTMINETSSNKDHRIVQTSNSSMYAEVDAAIVTPTGTNVGPNSEPNNNLHLGGTASLEKWESAIEPPYRDLNGRASGDNTRTDGNIMDERIVTTESRYQSAGPSVQSSYENMSEGSLDGGTVQTGSNKNDEHGFASALSIHTKNTSQENWESAVERNFHFDCNTWKTVNNPNYSKRNLDYKSTYNTESTAELKNRRSVDKNESRDSWVSAHEPNSHLLHNETRTSTSNNMIENMVATHGLPSVKPSTHIETSCNENKLQGDKETQEQVDANLAIQPALEKERALKTNVEIKDPSSSTVEEENDDEKKARNSKIQKSDSLIRLEGVTESDHQASSSAIGIDIQPGETALSVFASTLASNSEEEEYEDDFPGKCPGTMYDNGKDGNAEHQNIENKITGSVDEHVNTSLEDESSTTAIAMIVLAPSTGRPQLQKDARSSVNASPQGSSGITAGSALSPAERMVTTTGPGLQEQESVKPHGQKASNRAVPETKNSTGKTLAASNAKASKSLEDVIYVSMSDRPVRYNLRKRPEKIVETSLSGSIMNTGKRPRISSPGMALPLPFRVSDASPVRSNRSRYPQSSGSTNLRTPNQMDRYSRKRPNEDNSSSDSDQEAPIKRARVSHGNTSTHRGGPSRQPEGQSSGVETKPALDSRASGSTPRRSLNRTSHNPVATNIPKESPLRTNSSPRYNLRKSDPAKIEDGQQTEPVRIREIKKTGPETVVRTRTNLQHTISRVPRVNRANRDQGQNTRPVLVEDKKGSKSKPKDYKPTESDKKPKS